MSSETELTALQNRTEQLARNVHTDGYRQNPLRLSFVTELRDIVGQAHQLGQKLRGEEFTEGAGPDETCGCGEEITWYDGEWLHIANPALRGTDDHNAEPADGYYDPEDEEDEDDPEPFVPGLDDDYPPGVTPGPEGDKQS